MVIDFGCGLCDCGFTVDTTDIENSEYEFAVWSAGQRFLESHSECGYVAPATQVDPVPDDAAELVETDTTDT